MELSKGLERGEVVVFIGWGRWAWAWPKRDVRATWGSNVGMYEASGGCGRLVAELTGGAPRVRKRRERERMCGLAGLRACARFSWASHVGFRFYSFLFYFSVVTFV